MLTDTVIGFSNNKKYLRVQRTESITGWVPVSSVAIDIVAESAMTKSEYEDYKEEQEDFKKYVMKKDKRRSNYYNYYTTKKWGQLKNFDLTINSDLGIEKVADIIVELFQQGDK